MYFRLDVINQVLIVSPALRMIQFKLSLCFTYLYLLQHNPIRRWPSSLNYQDTSPIVAYLLESLFFFHFDDLGPNECVSTWVHVLSSGQFDPRDHPQERKNTAPHPTSLNGAYTEKPG